MENIYYNLQKYRMVSKVNKEKLVYIVTDTDEKASMISLKYIPTKCPICLSAQDLKPKTFHFNEKNDLVVDLNCVNNTCQSSNSALFLKELQEKDQYLFLGFAK